MNEQRVEAVERALSLLDSFQEDRSALSLAELAEITGMHKSTILRLAGSLQRFGYLIRNEDGVFRLGPTVQRLGNIYGKSLNLEAVIRPELERLRTETGETASFYVRDGKKRICLYRDNSTRAARHHLDEGVLLPLETGASGHVLRAFSTHRAAAEQAIRDTGYAVSLGERDPDLAAIAVPLIDDKGGLLGALTVSGIITRFTADAQKNIVNQLNVSADRIRKAIRKPPHSGSLKE